MLTDEEIKTIVYELCDITSDEWKMTDREIDILDIAEKHLRKGGTFNQKEKLCLIKFYRKYPNRKLDV